MSLQCPRCQAANPPVAHYCRNCGLALEVGATGPLGAGRAHDPQALTPPAEAAPVRNAADLRYWWEPVGGGRLLLGTETLVVNVFNGGYPLQCVTLRIVATDARGATVCRTEREIADWPRGAARSLELPSWELHGPVQNLAVELVTAEFGPDERGTGTSA